MTKPRHLPNGPTFADLSDAAYLGFEEAPSNYVGPTQRARFWTERWAEKSLFCANCGHLQLKRFPNNKPVADLYCPICDEIFEVKSKRGAFGSKVVDGAHRTMIDRLSSGDNPSLILLNYDLKSFGIVDAILVPKHFFVESLIEARKPLASTAKRAGWVGCNIRLDLVPPSGKIYFVRDRVRRDPHEVRERWREMLFLREAKPTARGWLLEVLRIVESLGRPQFTLQDVYAKEGELFALYPANKNIRPKIRQQLQVLRDTGILSFLGDGVYRLATSQEAYEFHGRAGL